MKTTEYNLLMRVCNAGLNEYEKRLRKPSISLSYCGKDMTYWELEELMQKIVKEIVSLVEDYEGD